MMKILLFFKMLRDMKRAMITYALSVLIVAVGFCGYSVLELSSRNLMEAKSIFFDETNFCDGFADVAEAPLSVVKTLEEIEGIEAVEGRLLETVRVSGYKEEVELLLVSVDAVGMNRPFMSKGALSETGQRGIVIGDSIAKARELTLGDEICLILSGQKVRLEITGMGLTPENIYMVKDMTDFFPNPRDYDAGFLSYETMSSMFQKEGRVNSFVFRLKTGVLWEEVEDEIKEVLKPYGCRSAYKQENQLSVSMLDAELEQLGNMSKAVPILFLLVAGVILSITLSRLVEQQRTQIGTLLALGISGKQVQLHYLGYGALIGFAGGLLGGVLGYLCADPMADFYRVYFSLPKVTAHVEWSYLLVGTTIATLFCGAIAWMISGSIGELSPAEAIRPAAPKEARMSLLEKIPGFSRVLTVSGLMAVRSLARHRRRAFLSLVGIAFAYMITASLVSMNRLFDVFIFDYWEKTQQQDLAVQFSVPVASQDALDAIRHPGIIKAEGVTEFSAELRGPDGRIDCGVQAIAQDSTLCRLFQEDGTQIYVDPQGIVISKHMSNRLGSGVGDFIEIKVHNPKEQTNRIPITGVIAQYMGNTAYMSYDGAAHISEYRDVYTSVFIKGTKQVRDDVLVRLEEATAVSLVESRQERVDKYRSMMGNMTAMMASMSMMGVIIGFSVIYVSSLISFEELKREIATLMTLGLNGSQCLEVITTGQWILTIGAIMLGIPMTMGVSRLMSATMASDLYSIPDFVDFKSLLQAMALTCLSVCFSSAVMLRKIKKMSPVELLRERE